VNEDGGPAHEVRWYLGDGLMTARWELDALTDEDRKSVESLADFIADGRMDLFHHEALRPLSDWHDELQTDPWIRFAVDLRLAELGLNRAYGALQRWTDLRPAFGPLSPSIDVQRYLREATQTYLYGFDAACIAFCGAAFERSLSATLIAAGVQTKGGLARMRLTGGPLLDAVEQHGLIDKSAVVSGRRILSDRNRIMHTTIWDDRILRPMAVECIRHLRLALNGLHC
jgi:hypothetical protein